MLANGRRSAYLRGSFKAAAGKGFGASSSQQKKKVKKQDESQGKKAVVSRRKGKNAFRPPAPPQQVKPPVQPDAQGLDLNRPPSLEDRFKEAVEKQEATTVGPSFEERLAALKETSKLLEKEKKLTAESKVTFAGEDVYANPPSIMDTLSGTQPDPEKVNPLGNNQLLVVLGTAVLGAVLIFSSIGPGGGSFVEQAGISPEEKAKLEVQLAGFEATLKGDPNDATALEGAAVTYANLQNYKKSEELLTKLTAIKSDDVDVWRLLGETRSALKDAGKAVAAYSEAYKRAGDDLEILKGYTGALVADGKPADAVREVKAAAERQRSSESAGTATKASPIELDLLLAKVYSQWRGHTTDALATYDAIIKENPSDFRGYLAKGVLLRQEGRKGDADRAFMQARFMAPQELRAIVDRVAAPEDPAN